MYVSPDPKDPIYCPDNYAGTDTDACVWSEVEVCVAIICACLPTLRALLNQSSYKRRGCGESERVDLARRPSTSALPEENREIFEVLNDEGLYPSKSPRSSFAEVTV